DRGNANPAELTEVNGLLYFIANDGVHGEELWRSDGTPNGTILVEDIKLGTGDASPHELTNVNGVLFFVADDGERRDNTGAINEEYSIEDLWKTDSNTGVTQRVRSFHKILLYQIFGITIAEPEEAPPSNLSNHNGTLVFDGFDIDYGHEVWKSDGTTQGTLMVENFAGDPDNDTSKIGSLPHDFVSVGDALYFNARLATGFTYNVRKIDDISIEGYGTITENLTYADLDKTYAEDPFNLHSVNQGLFFNSYYNEKDQNGNLIRKWSLFWYDDGINVHLIGGIPQKLDITTYERRNDGKLLYRVSQTDGTEELKITDGASVTDIVSGCGL
ncbi:MAG TPA: hypothetical protein ENK98_03880, partial [Epsilonproteobacteria bacterium]|nr:hypothetical protein [Campylobacterota bacterium]